MMELHTKPIEPTLIFMFSNVVYKQRDGKWTVEGITFVGDIEPAVVYDNLDAIPKKIREAVKRLMWLDPTDSEGIEGVGLRVLS